MAAVTVGELVQHLSSPRAAGTLLLLRSLEPVREDDRISETGVRSAERRLVDEALPTAPPPQTSLVAFSFLQGRWKHVEVLEARAAKSEVCFQASVEYITKGLQ